MSETPLPPESAPGAAAATEAKAVKPPSKLMLPLIVVVMTALGGAVGLLLVAPKLIANRAMAAGLEADSAGGEGEHGDGEEAVGGEKGPMFKIDNLIVNPAGSQGARFLMVSVAVETSDAKMEEHLRSREPQIRDIVIALLEQQTMEQLAAPGMRDSLKVQLGDTISVIAGVKTKLKVFLPQFVIQ